MLYFLPGYDVPGQDEVIHEEAINLTKQKKQETEPTNGNARNRNLFAMRARSNCSSIYNLFSLIVKSTLCIHSTMLRFHRTIPRVGHQQHAAFKGRKRGNTDPRKRRRRGGGKLERRKGGRTSTERNRKERRPRLPVSR